MQREAIAAIFRQLRMQASRSAGREDCDAGAVTAVEDPEDLPRATSTHEAMVRRAFVSGNIV